MSCPEEAEAGGYLTYARFVPAVITILQLSDTFLLNSVYSTLDPLRYYSLLI